MSDQPANDVITLAEQYRQQLAANDAKAMQRLITAYKKSFDNLQDKLTLLTDEIASGNYTPTTVHRLERYKALMAQVMNELRDMQALTKQEIEAASEFGVKTGLDHSRGLIAAQLGNEKLAVAFNKLNPGVVKTLEGFLSPDGALYERLGNLGSVSADRIATDLTNGIVSGYNPEKIASIFRQAWGMALTDAMRMTRTAQLWSYREASRANYINNRDVVTQWVWVAHLDDRTCATCLSMDGTKYELEEPLRGHYNCRCTLAPVVKGFPTPIEEGRGQAWFEQQTETVQQNTLGKGKYQAWKDGKFTLDDISVLREDKTYGSMWNEKTLKELIGE